MPSTNKDNDQAVDENQAPHFRIHRFGIRPYGKGFLPVFFCLKGLL
jgi:hypothetical protein